MEETHGMEVVVKIHGAKVVDETHGMEVVQVPGTEVVAASGTAENKINKTP